MARLFTNNAYGNLASGISNSATSISLGSGEGARFPALSGGDYFLATLIGYDVNGNENAWEIVKVTARATDTLTVVRAQDSTSAAAWSAATRIELRVTAEDMNAMATKTGTETLTNKTLTAPTIEGYTEGVSAPAAGSSFTVDLSADTVFGFTTNANATVTLPAPAAGKSFEVQIAYGGAHTLSWTVTGGSSISWPAATAPTPTSTSGKTDVFNFRCNAAGTKWLGAVTGQNYTT